MEKKTRGRKPATTSPAPETSDVAQASTTDATTTLPAQFTAAPPRKAYAKISEADLDVLLVLPISLCYMPDYDSRAEPGIVTEEFKASLRVHGQLTPVRVCRMEDNSYEIVDGRRRFRALTANGARTIKAVLQQPPTDVSDQVLRVSACITNMHRSDLTPYELALNVEGMVAAGMTTHQIAEQVNVTEAFISQLRGIFRLPAEIVEMFRAKKFEPNSLGKCRALARVSDAGVQMHLAMLAQSKNVNAEALNSIVSAYRLITGEDTVVVSDKDGESKRVTLTLDPRLNNIVLAGSLEPDSVSKVRALSKLRNFDQQFEMARIHAKKVADTNDFNARPHDPSKHRRLPTIDDLNEWISELRRQLASATIEEEAQEAIATGFEPKPLAAAKWQEVFDAWKDKASKYAKSEEPDPATVAYNKGVLKGMKLAAGG